MSDTIANAHTCIYTPLKGMDLCEENYKILLKEIKQDLKKQIYKVPPIKKTIISKQNPSEIV